MRQQQRGATLPQLLVALAVVCTLTGVGAYSIVQALPNYRLTQVARILMVHIRRARLEAIQRHATQYLDFDLDGDDNLDSGFCILWEDRNNNHHKEYLEKSRVFLDLTMPHGVCLQAYPGELGGPKRGPNNTSVDAGGSDGITFDRNRIKFNSNGTCSAGTIYVHNIKGRTFAIRLRSNGLIQLWRHNGGPWERW
jgi:type II secretory pathway pseudopilin PulG